MDSSIVFADLGQVRAATPLVHSITNFVVMNNTANALLCLGASPIMAHAPEELDEIVALVNAVVLNIGTLSEDWIASMRQAGRAANRKGVPVVLDPVGAGASGLRTRTAGALLQECAPAIVRGNASEILALASSLGAASEAHLQSARVGDAASRGVDSARVGQGIRDVAGDLARHGSCVVVVSGETDIVTDGSQTVLVHGGHALMPKVTGMGCTATAVVAAFAAVVSGPLQAAVSAMAVMSAAGAVAARQSQGPGTLQLHFYDALYALTAEDIATTIRLEVL